jgi:hypothetical protein
MTKAEELSKLLSKAMPMHGIMGRNPNRFNDPNIVCVRLTLDDVKRITRALSRRKRKPDK